MTNDNLEEDKTINYTEDPLYKISLENSKLEEEVKNLKRTVEFYQNELEKFRKPPFLISEVVNKLDNDKYIVKLPNQSNFLVQKSSQLDLDIKIGDYVVNEQRSLVIIDKVDIGKDYSVENYVLIEKPKISWKDIGGLDKEIEMIKEVLEMPLKKPKLFKEVGIEPPKGILLHGPPGTGKTMLAKALAKETNSTFIEIVGGELVQKYIGEGAKLVKNLFELAREKAPSIIFIDEIDAIASRRIENGTSGEREVQRTFMQLLAEMDGFKPLDNVKIIAATNRIDVLDEAIIRPGRLERIIEIKEPNRKGREEILKIHTKNMKLKNVSLKEIAKLTENFTGAELKALVTEAGYNAIRKDRKYVILEDFIKGKERIKKEEENIEKLSIMFN